MSKKTEYYITGDTHRNFTRLHEYFKNKDKKNKVLILLGDVGINFWKDPFDAQIKKSLNSLGITIFCVRGNHDMPLYDHPGYSCKLWKGGHVYYEPQYERILFPVDGEVFNFSGHHCMVIGGATSSDIGLRLFYGMPWFSKEGLDLNAKLKIKRKLMRRKFKIDIMLSHTIPYKYVDSKRCGDLSVERYLDAVEEVIDYRMWMSGHFHQTKRINDKVHIIYDQILRLDFTENKVELINEDARRNQ